MAIAATFCRNCGQRLSADEQAAAGNTICGACASVQTPVPIAASPAQASSASVSPGLAFLLGLLPGVGAIYNAQYAKGLLHVVIFGALIAIADSAQGGPVEAIPPMVVAAFFFYMPFEAYHTAKRRLAGETVDEFSSLLPVQRGGLPVAPVLLIVIGTLFLLHNLDLLRIGQVLRFWPVGLIALGFYMLYARLSERKSPTGSTEVGHDQ